jgi:hypothetical protein
LFRWTPANQNFLRFTLVNRRTERAQPNCQLLRYSNPVIVGGAIGRGRVLALFILPAFEVAPSIRVTLQPVIKNVLLGSLAAHFKSVTVFDERAVKGG